MDLSPYWRKNLDKTPRGVSEDDILCEKRGVVKFYSPSYTYLQHEFFQTNKEIMYEVGLLYGEVIVEKLY